MDAPQLFMRAPIYACAFTQVSNMLHIVVGIVVVFVVNLYDALARRELQRPQLASQPAQVYCCLLLLLLLLVFSFLLLNVCALVVVIVVVQYFFCCHS